MAQGSGLPSWKTPWHYFRHSYTRGSLCPSLDVPQLIPAGKKKKNLTQLRNSLSPDRLVSTFSEQLLLIMQVPGFSDTPGPPKLHSFREQPDTFPWVYRIYHRVLQVVVKPKIF